MSETEWAVVADALPLDWRTSQAHIRFFRRFGCHYLNMDALEDALDYGAAGLINNSGVIELPPGEPTWEPMSFNICVENGYARHTPVAAARGACPSQ